MLPRERKIDLGKLSFRRDDDDDGGGHDDDGDNDDGRHWWAFLQAAWSGPLSDDVARGPTSFR